VASKLCRKSSPSHKRMFYGRWRGRACFSTSSSSHRLGVLWCVLGKEDGYSRCLAKLASLDIGRFSGCAFPPFERGEGVKVDRLPPQLVNVVFRDLDATLTEAHL
jgi:hypothetical protein